jgi:hypothetical protein
MAEMARKRISPALQKAAEEYVASLGSSRARLTDAQWKIITRHISRRRFFKLALAVSILYAAFCFWAAHSFYHVLGPVLTESIPTTFVYVEQDNSTRVVEADPEHSRLYVRLSLVLAVRVICYCLIGTLMLASVLVRWFSNRRTDKTLAAFLSPVRKTRLPCLDSASGAE